MTVRWWPVVVVLGMVVMGSGLVIAQGRWTTRQRWLLGLIGCYLVLVGWLTFYPAGVPIFAGATKPLRHFGWITYNLRPLIHVNREFWANVAMTVPLGAFYYLARRHWRPLMLVCAALVPGLVIELGQLVSDLLVNLSRVVDVDDWLTNSLGVLVGFGLMLVLDRLSAGWLGCQLRLTPPRPSKMV